MSEGGTVSEDGGGKALWGIAEVAALKKGKHGDWFRKLVKLHLPFVLTTFLFQFFFVLLKFFCVGFSVCVQGS